MILSNSYKKAIDKIELSDELKDKIKKNITVQSKNTAPKICYKYIKRFTGIAACFVICFLSFYAVTNHNSIQPAEIVSETFPETNPTPSTDRTEENNVAEKNPMQDTTQNTLTEKNPNIETIPDNKIVASIDNTNKSAINSSVSNEKLKMSNNANAVEKKLDTETIHDNGIVISAGNTNESEVNSSDNDEQLKTSDNGNETVMPKQEIATAKNPPVTNNGLPPNVTGKRVTSEDNNASNDKIDIGQITAELEYEIKYPQKLPEEYNTINISVVDKNIAEITYQSETDTITYRTAKGTNDISGDNNSYTDIEIVKINNSDVTLKGNGDLYHNAGWTEAGETFSLCSNNGIEKDTMVDIIESVN